MYDASQTARRTQRRAAASALLMCASVVFTSAYADAHSSGLSRGDYRLSGGDLQAELVFARPELTAVVPALDADHDGVITAAELSGARPLLERILVDGIVVTGPAAACPGVLRDAALTEEDGLVVRAVYHCEGTPDTVAVELKLFASLTLGHRQIATDGVGELVAYEGNAVFRVRAAAAAAPADALGRWRQGVGAFLDWPHVALLLGLLLVGTLRSRLFAVAAFSLGHGVSVTLVALHGVLPGARFAVVACGLSIIYVGLLPLFVREGARRWMSALPFGVVHGFGLAAGLAAPTPGALLVFVLGVLVAQMGVVLLALPALWWLNRQRWFARHGNRVLGAGVALCGVWWLVRAI